MTVLYIEPFSGISGDMLLGALCGLKDDYDTIVKLPKLLALDDAKVEVSEVQKNGISCKHVRVFDLSRGESRKHRKLKEILDIINKGNISDKAKETARNIFSIIGESESRIHNTPLEDIHFHELSGVDSIIDIVGCAVLLEELNVSRTYSDPICTGHGFVKTQHGILPIPAPATADILMGMHTYKGNEEGEKVTPTGAAVLKYLNPNFNIPIGSVKKIAYGPGEKDFKGPNVLRVSLVDLIDTGEDLYLIETNIDDTPAEYLGIDFQESLMEYGAKDFYFTQVQMKKGRPGVIISILVENQKLTDLSNFILETTSSIGLRFYPVSRHILARRSFEIDTKYGKVKVKEVIKPSGTKSFKIEYESLIELSKKNHMSIQNLQAKLLQIVTNQER